MSNTAKWVICVICAVLGVVALVYAVIYLAVQFTRSQALCRARRVPRATTTSEPSSRL